MIGSKIWNDVLQKLEVRAISRLKRRLKPSEKSKFISRNKMKINQLLNKLDKDISKIILEFIDEDIGTRPKR